MRQAWHRDVTTLDYWRRAHRKQKPTLVRVAMEAAQPLTGFALVLANGRRIESSWSFSASDLEKLIRVAEGLSRVFGLGLATKIYIAVEAVDMRKGFEGLVRSWCAISWATIR